MMVRPSYPIFALKSYFGEMFTRRGVNHLLAGFDYFGALEYSLVVEQLDLTKGMHLLDVGSGNSLFPLFEASMGCEVWATDIDDSVLDLQQTSDKFKVKVHAEVQNAQETRYSRGYFDRISAVSVLEHIPDEGDKAAIDEFSRVLKPGGLAVVTVPFGAYEKERQKNVNMFQRIYSVARIAERFTHPRLTLEKTLYFGEKKYNFISHWYRLPLIVRLLVFWTQPFFSRLFLKHLTHAEYSSLSGKAKRNFDMTAGICLVYRRK